MVDLSNIKNGDVVIFKNGELAKVKYFSIYENNKFDIYFDRPIFGRVNKSNNWSYFRNGIWVRPDLQTPCNDIVKILVDK